MFQWGVGIAARVKKIIIFSMFEWVTSSLPLPTDKKKYLFLFLCVAYPFYTKPTQIQTDKASMFRVELAKIYITKL